MGKTALVEPSIDAGRLLIGELDKSAIPITAAFWWLERETGDWLFVLATPAVDRSGRRSLYRRIEHILHRIASREIRLEDVSIVSDRDPRVQLLGVALKTGPGISGIRFQNNVINGVLVEDAYIYRLA